jgi:hypothetical protein
MAYAKSKSSYPAWAHSWVSIMATAAKHNRDLEELPFPTEAAAKKARFELYGLLTVMEHNTPQKGTPEATIREDREVAQFAKQWSIGFEFNPHLEQWMLTFKFKNSPTLMSPIFNAIFAMEEKLKDIREKDFAPGFQPNARTAPAYGEEALPSSIPTIAAFYETLLDKMPPSEGKNLLLRKKDYFPDPFRRRTTQEEFSDRLAQACGLTPDDFFAITGMRSFASMCWANSGYLLSSAGFNSVTATAGTMPGFE